MQARNTNVKFLLRRATATQWASSRRILLDGEPGYDTTNNILKIGREGKLWSELQAINAGSSGTVSNEWIQYYLLNQPPNPNPISYLNESSYKEINWTYPSQISVGFNQEPLPMIRALNIRLLHDGGIISIVDNVSQSPYIYRSGSSAPITKLKLYADSTSSNVINGNTLEYRNTDLLSLTGNPRIEVWYTNYSQTPVSKSTVNISTFLITPGPPSQVRSLRATETSTVPRELQISFLTPEYGNDTIRTDRLVRITGYKVYINVPGRPSLNKADYDIGTNTTFIIGTAYAGQRYEYRVYAYNSYGLSSQTSLESYTVNLPPPITTLLSFNTSSITYFSNVIRYITSGNQKISSNLPDRSLINTVGDISATGRFPIGDVSIGGAITSLPLSYSSSSAAVNRNILNTTGTQIGTIMSSMGATDFYNDRPDWAGTTGFYMPSNTITLTSLLTLFNTPSQDVNNIDIITANARTRLSFYISNISNSNRVPSIQDQVMSTSINKKYVSGFNIGARINISVKAVTTRATFGDFFFPNNGTVVFNVLGQTSTYEITNMYTVSNDVFWVIEVPSPSPSQNQSIKNPQTPINQHISTSLYAGPIQGTVTIKNLNGQTTSNLTPSGFGSDQNLFIDDASYNFVQSNRVALMLPLTAINPGSSPYNNSASIQSSQDMIVYNGKYRSPAAIPNNVRSVYSINNTGPRFVTFEYDVGSGPYTSILNIIITGIESNIYQTSGNWQINIGTNPLYVYYRFESQYTSSTGLNYRIPQGQYQLSDVFLSTNYTTGWIDANSTSPQNVTTSNYNQSAILNGLVRSVINSNSAVFQVFQPNIYIGSGSPTVKLYVTIGSDHFNNVSFSACNVNFS